METCWFNAVKKLLSLFINAIVVTLPKTCQPRVRAHSCCLESGEHTISLSGSGYLALGLSFIDHENGFVRQSATRSTIVGSTNNYQNGNRDDLLVEFAEKAKKSSPRLMGKY